MSNEPSMENLSLSESASLGRRRGTLLITLLGVRRSTPLEGAVCPAQPCHKRTCAGSIRPAALSGLAAWQALLLQRPQPAQLTGGTAAQGARRHSRAGGRGGRRRGGWARVARITEAAANRSAARRAVLRRGRWTRLRRRSVRPRRRELGAAGVPRASGAL